MAKYGWRDKWPPKPAKGETCDAHIGLAPDSFGMPLLKRCRAEAVETCFVSETMFVEMHLCAGHAHLGFRNPRKRAAAPTTKED